LIELFDAHGVSFVDHLPQGRRDRSRSRLLQLPRSCPEKELEERIPDLGRNGSWPDILAELDSLTESKVEQDDKCFLLRSPPRPAASLALSATGVALPPTVRQVDQA